MLRLLSAQSASIASAATLVAVISLGSRLLGVLRDRLLASTFGAGDVLDAYYAAFRIPDFVFSLAVLGALSAGFIPLFSQLEEERAWKFANAVLSWLLLGLGVLSLGIVLFAQPLVAAITPGFSGAKLELAVSLARIMALSPLLLGLSNVFGGALQSRRLFFLSSAAPVLYNVGIILGVVLFVPVFGAHALAFGVLLGAVLHLLIQVGGARSLGWTPSFSLLWSAELKQMLWLSSSRLGGIVLSQLDLFVATIVATTLSAGSLTIFQLANNIQLLPVGLIGISFAISAFPALSASAVRNMEQFRRELAETTLLILFFVLPATVLLLLLRAQVVRVVLGGEAFDWRATILTFQTLQWFALSLFAQSLIPLFARAFYALGLPRLPLIASTVGLLAAVTGYMLFTPRLGVAGLAAAVSIGSLLQCTLLYVSLQRKIHCFDDARVLRSLARMLFASFAMAGWVQWSKTPIAAVFGTATFTGVAAQVFFGGVVGVCVYGLLCWLLGSAELATVLAGVKRRLVRQAPAPKEVV